MIIDKAMELSGSQVVTASAKSTGTLDLGKPGAGGYSVGADNNPGTLVITVDEAATAAGAATVEFQLRTSANADMSSPTILERSGAIGKAALTVGAKVPFSPNLPWNALRYVDLYYSVATGPLTAGKFSAQWATARQTNIGA